MTTHKNTLAVTLIISLVVLPAMALVAVPQAEASNSNIQYSNEYFDKLNQLLALIYKLQVLLIAQNQMDRGDRGGSGSDLNMTTLPARDIDENSAELRGKVHFGNSDTADVWFEYGKNRFNLNNTTDEINLDDSDNKTFTKTVSGLNDDTLYYFRAVGEDEDGDEDMGSTLSFRTDEDGNNDDDNDDDGDKPDVQTEMAEDVTDDSAELNGSVDMNDFSDGNVFFVFGEDEDMVMDVESDFSTYTEIDESGDDLQKVLVDSGLDNQDDYTFTADNLDDDTDHFFSMCVEYENEDDDQTIVCGDVEEFTTDTN